MSAGDNAIFSEVLAISVDTDFFAQQMKAVEEIYAASLSKMPNLGDIGTAGLTDQFKTLATQLEQSVNAVKGVSEQVATSLANVGTAGSQVFSAVTDALAVFISKLEQASGSTSAAVSANDALAGSVDKQEAAERKRFAMIEQAEKEMRQYISTVEQAATANEKFNAPGGVVGSGVAFGPQTREDAEDNFRRMAALQDQAIKANEKFGESQNGIVGSGALYGPKTLEEAEKDFRRMAGLQDQAIKENERFTASVKEANTSFGAQVAEFAERVSTMAERMAEFYLIFQVFRALKAVISAPFEALKEGFSYLENLQEQSSQIRAVLLDTENFSTDPAKNMAMASTEADRLARGVQDLAAKMHVSAPIIRAGFDTFLERGGGNLTQNNDQSLQLAGLAAAGLQTQLPGVNARFQATELTKLVQGTLTEANKLPAAFGLSAEKLNEMSKAAQTTHDLYLRIVAASPGLADRLGSANARMDSLTAAVELLKQRFEGLIAGPVFERVIGWLNELLTWFDKNREAVTAFGKQLGEAFDNMAQGIAVMVKTNWSILLDGLRGVLQTFVNIGWALASIVNSVSVLSALKAKLDAQTGSGSEADALRQEEFGIDSRSDGFGKPGSTQDATRRADIEKRIAAIRDKQQADAEIQYGDAINARDAINSSFIKATNAINGPLPNYPKDAFAPANPTQKRGIDSTAKDLPGIGKDFSNGLKQLEAEYQMLRDVVKDAESDRSISARQAATEIIKYNDDEIKSIQRLADEEIKRVRNSHATDATPEKKAERIKEIQARADTAMQTARHQEEEAQRHGNAEAQAIEKNNTAALLALQKQQYSEELAQQEQAYSLGKINRQQLAQARIAAAEQEYQAEVTFIKKRQGEISPDDVEHAQLDNRLAQLQDAHEAIQRRNTTGSSTAARQDAVAAEQESIALQRAVDAQGQLNVRALETGTHYREALSLSRQLLAVQTELATRELALAEAELTRLGNSNKNTEEYQKQLVVVQNLKNGLTSAYERQINASRDSAAQTHPFTPLSSGDKAAQKTADDLASKAQQIYEFSVTFANVLGLTSDQLQVLKASAEAAAEAQRRVAEATKTSLDRIEDVSNVFSKLESGLGSYLSGQSGGRGVIGGLGSALSDSSLTGKDGLLTKGAGLISDTLGKAVPIIGPLIGGMFSTITSLFQAGIQKMVDAINEQIQNIQNDASSGKIGLGQEITELQAEKQSAIEQLGGSKKKGAQDQLNKILQTLNAQIAQLQYQQQQIITGFNNMVKAGSLDTLSGTFTQWYSTWQSINEQVKQYVDAGGSVATANQFLNQQLALQRQQLVDQLNQGEQTALNDAVQLNQLLTQRVQLMKQEAATEFGIINADSEERRVSSAVKIGSQLEQQRYQYSQQLLQLNNQITLDQQRLTVEGKIFDVNKDLAALQAASNALTIASLNEQLAKYQDMITLLKQTAGLTFSGPISNLPTATLPIPGEPGIAGPVVNIGTINVGVHGNVTDDNASTLGAEIARNIASGRTNFRVTP